MSFRRLFNENLMICRDAHKMTLILNVRIVFANYFKKIFLIVNYLG
jgi:hypothetical protein